MEEPTVRKPPLVWWAGGLLLGLTQVLAISLKKPLAVSTQFVVANSVALRKVAPDYATAHKLIGDARKDGKVVPNKEYAGFGYGWWLDVGLLAGALLAALASRRWKLRCTTVWWRAGGRGVLGRLVTGLIGGFLILMGARFAHGCTSGQFASGWAQLSLSVVPFTVTMFLFGMIAARIFYPKVPTIER
jgi:hypothetical protein